MSDKVWIIGDSIYKTESGFKRELQHRKKYKQFKDWKGNPINYKVFELTEEGSIDSLIEQLERDEKLKAILDEIPDYELKLKEDVKNLLDIINKLYNDIEKDNSELKWGVYYLNESVYNPKKFIRILKARKHSLFKLSNTKEYFLALLKVHNFRSITKYLDESYHNAFKAAKLELKKIK